MHKITRKWIHEWSTPAGGWTREQLAIIGVKWPPATGWIDRAADGNRRIFDIERQRFEELSGKMPHPQRDQS